MRESIETWARRAHAANGFGDAGIDMPERPASYELYHAARAHRAFMLAEILRALIGATADALRRAQATWRQRRQARYYRLPLQEIDDRTLRDIGLVRSEIGSVAAELAGAAAPTRIHVAAISYPTRRTASR